MVLFLFGTEYYCYYMLGVGDMDIFRYITHNFIMQY